MLVRNLQKDASELFRFLRRELAECSDFFSATLSKPCDQVSEEGHKGRGDRIAVA